MKIKICGLTRQEDVDLAVECGANYLGFIFVENTPRAMELDQAKELIKSVPESVHPVAVILNNDPKAKDYLQSGFHYLQVIGGLVDGIDRTKQIPVYHVSAETPEGKDDPELKLFDTKVGKQLGGTGKTFDLTLLEGARSPYFVAGGFNPDNLSEVIDLQPFGIDVSSGLEAEPRIKDHDKMKKFVKQLNRSDT